MPNVPEDVNWGAIVPIVVGASRFQLTEGGQNVLSLGSSKPLLADSGIAQGVITPASYGLSPVVSTNFLSGLFSIIEQMNIRLVAGNLSMLKDPGNAIEGNLSMLTESPVMVIDSIDAAPPGFAPPPPSSQQTRGSGPGYQWIVMCDQKGRKLVGFYTGYISTDTNPRQLIEDLPCDFVILSVQTTLDDNIDTLKATGSFAYFDTNEEVYWGFGTVCIHQIFPGETTQYLAVRNANQLSVRCSKSNSGIAVAFSAFRYEEEDVVL
jgi:hypothetical protein